ncbi:MAG: nitroreductase family protein [Candidatus Lokiarchaeota archaeon]|nr:nitroreductase family protein [Candidatus Lokiarchaeota archaeon]
MNVKEAIEKRRAYRSLDPFEISTELINDFASVAQITPSCANKQPWKFIFIYDQDKLTELYSVLSEGNKWVEKASMIIAVFSRPEFDCIIGDRLYYLFDTGMATALIILRATELGLVAHPIAGFKEDMAKKILGIPEDMRLITLIIIGKHSKFINPVLSDAMKLGEKQRPPRKKLEDFVFINNYNQKISK